MKNTNANRNLDEEGLTAIFDQYALTIYKYALRFCHDSIAGDNIVGDTFAELLEQTSFGKGLPSDIRPYLYQITYNRLIQGLRDGQYKRSLAPVLSAQEKASLSQSQPQDEREEIKEGLISALDNELTEDQRHMLVLHLLEGFGIEESAVILGKKTSELKASLGSIRSIIEGHPDLLTASLIAKLRILRDPTINTLLPKKNKPKWK